MPVINSNLQATYQVWLLNHEGTRLRLLESYETLKYLLVANGEGVREWSSYSIQGAAEKMYTDDFLLDYMVSIRRKAPGMPWRTELEGFHRRSTFSYDAGGREMFESAGPDLTSLVKNRVVIPPAGQAFLTRSGPFTDVMRALVRTQCAGLVEDPARRMYHLTTQANTGEGDTVTFSTRDNCVATDLQTLSDLGGSFVIERAGSALVFKVYYPRLGTDRRVDNLEGNAPVVFSLANLNMKEPAVISDRLAEINVVYVLGQGAGADREIIERHSVWDSEDDSPWNRRETMIDESSQTSQATLMALGDALLTESREKKSFVCQYVPSVGCLYGRDWFVGDVVTGIYRGVSYPLRVDSVEVTWNQAQGEVLQPTLRWFPGALM